LAAALCAGCEPTVVKTCYIVVNDTPTVDESWWLVYWCWHRIRDANLPDPVDAENRATSLRSQHHHALSVLAASAQVTQDVADAMDVAFDEALRHIRLQRTTCYEPNAPRPPEFAPRDDLIRRTHALEEMRERSEVDADTAQRMASSLERDIAWLARFRTGLEPGGLDEVAISDADKEAARLLVDLILAH
jgi:hypothetical protein